MKIQEKHFPFRITFECDECQKDMTDEDDFYQYGSEQLCSECVLGRYDKVDRDG